MKRMWIMLSFSMLFVHRIEGAFVSTSWKMSRGRSPSECLFKSSSVNFNSAKLRSDVFGDIATRADTNLLLAIRY